MGWYPSTVRQTFEYEYSSSLSWVFLLVWVWVLVEVSRPAGYWGYLQGENIITYSIQWWWLLDQWNYEGTYQRDTKPYSFRQVARDLLYSQSHTRGWTRSLITQSWGTRGKVKLLRHKADSNCRPACRSTVEHANHQTTTTTPIIYYTPGPQRGGGVFSLCWPIGGSSAKLAPPRGRSSQGAFPSGLCTCADFPGLYYVLWSTYREF